MTTMNYTNEQITNVKAELAQIKKTNRPSSSAHIFARDAHQAICNAYKFDWQTKEHSLNEEAGEFKVTKANDILELALTSGVDEIVYGAGRVIVQRK